jgi:hypothetical protein
MVGKEGERRMRNPILVFLASIDHHSFLLNKVFKKARIYDLMEPHVFEYYCVFCRGVCTCWWDDYWRSDVDA